MREDAVKGWQAVAPSAWHTHSAAWVWHRGERAFGACGAGVGGVGARQEGEKALPARERQTRARGGSAQYPPTPLSNGCMCMEFLCVCVYS